MIILTCMGSRVEPFEAADGWRWHAVSGNNEIVAGGEAYRDEHDARRGIEAARKVFRETDPEYVALRNRVMTLEAELL